MKKKNIFYIYAHFKKTNNELFYIGKGKDNRINEKNNRNKYWKNTVNKYGYYSKLIEQDLNENDSLKGEIFYIKHFKMIGCKLTNMTDGGEGVSGCIPNQETRNKMAKAKLGKKGNRLGYKTSEETKQKLSKLNSGTNHPKFGTTHSTETRLKISLSRINKKEIIQFSKDGKLIKEWNSITEAAQTLNIFDSNIVKCLKCKIKSYKGFIWTYKNN